MRAGNCFRKPRSRQSDLPPELISVAGEVVGVRIAGREFPCDSEALETTVPKSFLTGFKLSDLPERLIVKPVESINGSTFEVKNDFGLSSFRGGSASAFVEVMYRRKYWDGDVGLSRYIEALRHAINERDDSTESDFQDDGDSFCAEALLSGSSTTLAASFLVKL